MSERTRTYYDRSAAEYDDLHGGDKDPEHIRALQRSLPLLDTLNLRSALEVGCGTARSLAWLGRQRPTLRLAGVEPSSGMLDLARKRLPDAEFEVAQGEALRHPDRSFDLVFATGVMHHADRPAAVIHEMKRVASRAVLISDHNNFAFGSAKMRRVRRWLAASGLLGAVTFVKQGFRKQGYSKEDGWWYPYSLFDDYATVVEGAEDVYIIPTSPARPLAGGNLLMAQSHFAILAILPGAPPTDPGRRPVVARRGPAGV